MSGKRSGAQTDEDDPHLTCGRHLRPSLATVTSPAAVSCGRHLRPSPRLSWPMRRRPMRSRAAMLCAITFGLALNMLLMGCMLHLRRFASLAVHGTVLP